MSAQAVALSAKRLLLAKAIVACAGQGHFMGSRRVRGVGYDVTAEEARQKHITDTGPGVSAEALEYWWEPNERTPEMNTRNIHPSALAAADVLMAQLFTDAEVAEMLVAESAQQAQEAQ